MPSSADATVMWEVPFEEMVEQADVIVRARVVATGTRVVLGQNGLEPQRVTSLAAIDDLKGTAERIFEVREAGGELDGERYEVLGAPRFTPGEEVVLFLERATSGSQRWRTLQMVQGKFQVVRPPTGPVYVKRDLGGIAFARWQRDGFRVEPAATDAGVELGVFLSTIRSLGAAKRGGR
jgi:hypothetical protein